MGLLYLLPISEKESGQVEIKESKDGNKTLVLKSYGLPRVFWIYLFGISFIFGALLMASWSTLLKLSNSSDPINALLGIIVFITMFGIPSVLICFFFYEKRIKKSKHQLRVENKVFGIPFVRRNFILKDTDGKFQIKHQLESPNYARIQNKPGTGGFQNRGYYQVYAELKNGKSIFLDRHSNLRDSKKLVEFLNSF
jgi:hypothetical protein